MRKLALLVLWLIVPVALAQMDATQWRRGSLDINHGWREQDGDDQGWSEPNLDDSGWREVELNDRVEPGWRWYRLRVRLADGHPHLYLLVAGGEGTYELYINGQPVVGPQLRSSFGVKRPTEMMFPLRDRDTELTLALRTHTPRGYAAWQLPGFLGMAVGTYGAIDDERLGLESDRWYTALPSIAINLVLMLAGLGAFALFRSQRNRAEYLWLGWYLFLLGTSDLLVACSTTGILPLAWGLLFGDALVYAFTIMQIQFTFSIAGKRVPRMWRTYEALLLTPLVFSGATWFGGFSSGKYMLIEAAIIAPAAVLLPLRLLVWFLRGNREMGPLVLPSMLSVATTALYDVGTASILLGWGRADFLASPIPVGPISLQWNDVGNLVFLLAIATLMFFRFTRVTREQMRVAGELSAARDIQRRLVPETLPEIAGYAIEAAYFPAEEVGGDFYQVLDAKGGAKLVVLGDVSGKGLQAAMTVSLLVGTLRTLVDQFSALAQFPAPQPRCCDLNRVAEEALALFAGRLDGITVQWDLEPGLPEVVADPESIRRALANLIDNAAEAMQGSLLRVLGIHSSLSEDGGSVELVVSDTGHGLTDEIRERLFLPFYSTKSRGTGLGLSIAAKIVQEHGGSLRAESNSPKGARFLLRLPLMEPAGGAQAVLEGASETGVKGLPS